MHVNSYEEWHIKPQRRRRGIDQATERESRREPICAHCYDRLPVNTVTDVAVGTGGGTGGPFTQEHAQAAIKKN